jgi:hypothetical protein
MIEKVCVVRTKSTHIPHKGLNKTLDHRNNKKQGCFHEAHRRPILYSPPEKAALGAEKRDFLIEN